MKISNLKNDSSYQITARKCRPQIFDEVIGQDHIILSLKQMILESKIASAYLFSGFRGVGKTSMARIFSKSLNCEKGIGIKPCGECSICVEIKNSNSTHVIEIDGASNRGIDEIKKIREDIQYLTGTSRYKIYIIDEVHMLTDQAFNALLKTLEEPPLHVIFIFATTEFHKVKLTIRSRCQQYFFKPVAFKEMKLHLINLFNVNGFHDVEESLIKELIRKSKGSLRDLQNFFDQVLIYCNKNLTFENAKKILFFIEDILIQDFLKSVFEKNIQKALQIVQIILDKGLDHYDFFEKIINSFKLILFLKKISVNVVKNNDHFLDVNADTIDFLNKYKSYLNENEILRIMKLLLDIHVELRKASYLNFILESFVYKLFFIIQLKSPESVLLEIEKLKTSIQHQILNDNSESEIKDISVAEKYIKENFLVKKFNYIIFLNFLKEKGEKIIYQSFLKINFVNLKANDMEIYFLKAFEKNIDKQMLKKRLIDLLKLCFSIKEIKVYIQFN